MATIYKSAGRQTYEAKIKLWNEGLGKWVWKKVATGCRDPDKALAVAVTLEGASVDANGGRMTREKAEALVDMVLNLAGSQWLRKSQTLKAYGDAVIEARIIKAGNASKIKFGVHWDRFKVWAGDRLLWPLERWTGAMMEEYYADLLTDLSERTASDHLSTLRLLFERAKNEGLIKGNPVLLVDKDANNSTSKTTFTRTEAARIARTARKDGKKEWALLTLLGWHTGHRLQDLLSLTKHDLEKVKAVGWVLTIKPDKKIHLGGRTVRLPVPEYLALSLRTLGNFNGIRGAVNVGGKASVDFLAYVKAAGIDPLPVKKKKRTFHLKTFHSFRHSMVSRLIAAGVQGETARLVTDHDSAQVHKLYTHAEIESLAKALKLARGK